MEGWTVLKCPSDTREEGDKNMRKNFSDFLKWNWLGLFSPAFDQRQRVYLFLLTAGYNYK